MKDGREKMDMEGMIRFYEEEGVDVKIWEKKIESFEEEKNNEKEKRRMKEEEKKKE